jgi:hypothetical protein
MDPTVPELPNTPIEVGSFEQGTEFSRWALARYLVGRAIGESVSRTLVLVAVIALGLAAVSTWVLHIVFLTVLLVIFAAGVLFLALAVRALLRWLTAVDRYSPGDRRFRSLVTDTHRDVMRELRRIGLPGRTLTMPLLAARLAGRRRKETLARLRAFDVERAVPGSRVDELHMLLRSVADR